VLVRDPDPFTAEMAKGHRQKRRKASTFTGNRSTNLVEMRAVIGEYRKAPIAATDNPSLGCIMLAEPFFSPENERIPVPPDFSLNIVQGKGYDTGSVAGQALWAAVSERLAQRAAASLNPGPATIAAAEGARYGQPMLVRPRLGQGLFRVLVTDAYDRRCGMTNARTLPVLQAAHIKPYALDGPHDLNNGLLLRSDLHTLFDQGYVSVDPVNMRMLSARESGKSSRTAGITTRSMARLSDCRRTHRPFPPSSTWPIMLNTYIGSRIEPPKTAAFHRADCLRVYQASRQTCS
jgi:HNH endonuclease